MLSNYFDFTQEIKQPRWQRIMLLAILGYEGFGGLLGGVALVVEPDGHLMDLPRNLMNGFFPDFFIPGLILTAMGMLNAAAFIALLRKTKIAWILANMAMIGFTIWFIVEIIIIREIHWLHGMWGLPVLVGDFLSFPLIPWKKK